MKYSIFLPSLQSISFRTVSYTHLFRRRVTAILCSLLVGLSWAVTTVFAADNGDIEQNASLTVYFGKNGEGFADVEFSIYRIAEISQDGSYTLTGDFKNYPVNLENLTSSGWRALAQTLDAYAARDHLQPLQVKKTGQDGQVVFSGLSTGLYLVKGEMCIRDRSENHTHTDDCYEHQAGGDLLCPLEETEGHTHDASCYQQGEPVLICGTERCV